MALSILFRVAWLQGRILSSVLVGWPEQLEVCHELRGLMDGRGTTAPMPENFSNLGDYPNLTAALERRGWGEARIRKVLGENWLRVLKDVWGA